MKQVRSQLSNLIEKAKAFGLSEVDLGHATEFKEHFEYELCFDTIVTQLYEHSVKIDEDYYAMINETADVLKIPTAKFSFVKELVNEE